MGIIMPSQNIPATKRSPKRIMRITRRRRRIDFNMMLFY